MRPHAPLAPPARARRRVALTALLLATALGFAFGCEYRGNTQTPQQPQQPPQPGYPPGVYPPPGTQPPYPGSPQPGQPPQPTAQPPAPAPTQTQDAPPPQGAPAPPIVAAIGLPCFSDNDLQCAFGRCVNGRCGGCTQTSDCKGGAACSQTPFGMACVYAGGAPGPAPTSTAPAPAPTTPPAGPDVFAAARHACLERTNGYRARVGVAPLSRRADHEACTDQQAKDDAAANRAHATFGRCGEASQNECPGYPGTPETVVAMCLEQMFNEGPGEPYSAHGHYINMTEKSYNGVACGFFVAPDGKIWLVQNFFR